MIRAIDRLLREQGYEYLQVSPPEAGVYYLRAGNELRVILGIHGHEGFSLSAQQFVTMEDNLKKALVNLVGKKAGLPEELKKENIEMLTILLTDCVDRYKDLDNAGIPVWFYDISQARLYIYENQPGDFHGMRDMLEGMDGAVSETKQNRVKDRRLPWITLFLAAVNIVVYFVLSLGGDTESAEYIYAHGGLYAPAVEAGEYYRLFTCMFLHFGIVHLMDNMLVLILAGSQIERGVSAWKYLLVYLGSGLGGSLLSFAMMCYSGDDAVAAGASGAIFGLIGLLLCLVIRHHGRYENINLVNIVLMILLCVYDGFTNSGVDIWGHVGGLIMGFFLAWILGMGYTKTKRNTENQ